VGLFFAHEKLEQLDFLGHLLPLHFLGCLGEVVSRTLEGPHNVQVLVEQLEGLVLGPSYLLNEGFVDVLLFHAGIRAALDLLRRPLVAYFKLL
jgi:hypothetical protein